MGYNIEITRRFLLTILPGALFTKKAVSAQTITVNVGGYYNEAEARRLFKSEIAPAILGQLIRKDRPE